MKSTLLLLFILLLISIIGLGLYYFVSIKTKTPSPTPKPPKPDPGPPKPDPGPPKPDPGPDPKPKKCPNDCSDHGECNTVTGECKCDELYGGEDCSITCPSTDKGLCNGPDHGSCIHGKCYCKALYGGKDCTLTCPSTDKGFCNGPDHGECIRGVCKCKLKWKYPDCVEPASGCKQLCEHGVCNTQTGECECSPGWVGISCNIKCPDCGKHGKCALKDTTAVCECDPTYYGPTCDIHNECPDDEFGKICSDHGNCDYHTGKCSCEQGWIGDNCEIPSKSCPGDGKCGKDNEQGTCNHLTGQCECKGEWLSEYNCMKTDVCNYIGNSDISDALNNVSLGSVAYTIPQCIDETECSTNSKCGKLPGAWTNLECKSCLNDSDSPLAKVCLQQIQAVDNCYDTWNGWFDVCNNENCQTLNVNPVVKDMQEWTSKHIESKEAKYTSDLSCQACTLKGLEETMTRDRFAELKEAWASTEPSRKQEAQIAFNNALERHCDTLTNYCILK